MPAVASPARIAANRANALKSTGPKTPEGKERSRVNACKHGLAGEGVVVPEQDLAEVERLSLAFRSELGAEGEAGRALARRMAVLSVRMDRAVEQENAALSARVRRAMEEFEAPEGLDPAEAARLREEAGRRALFDDSKEATLARKYEAAAERGFFRALKEIRQLNREAAAVTAPASPAAEVVAQAKETLRALGSFEPASVPPPKPAPARAPAPPKPPVPPSSPLPAAWEPFAGDRVDVPIAIGKRR